MTLAFHFTRRWLAMAAGTLLTAGVTAPAAHAQDATKPIKVGFSGQLTGPNAAAGKPALLTHQIWVEDVNARGGLLGRKVELVYYDDQSNPANVPGIFTKLITVDKVDLLTGQGTNLIVPAMPIIMEHKKLVMSNFALAVNDTFKYERYFQMMPYGPKGKEEIGRGFFEVAMTMDPKPMTVALVGADGEFSNNALEGARAHIKRLGLKIVYDRTYPPNNQEFGSIARAIKATNPDLVFAATYPLDCAGLMRAVKESALKTKMFGGAMVGWQFAAFKAQFGEGLNGVVNYELFVREPTMNFPGVVEFVNKYRQRAPAAGTDLLGHYVPPFIYAADQVLEQAVKAVGGLDDDKLAQHIRKSKFSTVVGDVAFGADGEWAEPHIIMTQFQKVKGNDLAQFDTPGVQVILYPPKFKSGTLQYPYPPEAK